MFNQHLSLNIFRLCPLVIESLSLNVTKFDVTVESYDMTGILSKIGVAGTLRNMCSRDTRYSQNGVTRVLSEMGVVRKLSKKHIYNVNTLPDYSLWE